MSKYEKAKERILSVPPPNDITPTELQNFLNKCGFVCKRAHGSHFIYEYPAKQRRMMLNIPMHNPVKPTYIDQVRECMEEILGENYE